MIALAAHRPILPTTVAGRALGRRHVDDDARARAAVAAAAPEVT
jgi:hypothetical protein